MPTTKTSFNPTPRATAAASSKGRLARALAPEADQQRAPAALDALVRERRERLRIVEQGRRQHLVPLPLHDDGRSPPLLIPCSRVGGEGAKSGEKEQS